MNSTSVHQFWGSAAVRGSCYLALWVLLIGFNPVDLLVGLAATAAATRTSLWLLPPGEFRLKLPGLLRYGLRFAWQSLIAGVDVARRAFAPDMRLRTGLVSYTCRYPRGAKRNAFASLTSLLPGTLALRDEPDVLLYHCLDTTRPVTEQLAEEEAALSRALPFTSAP